MAEQLLGPFHPSPGEVLAGGLAERGAKGADKVERGVPGLAGEDTDVERLPVAPVDEVTGTTEMR